MPIRNKRIQNLKKFTRHIGRGMHVELKETIEIPSLLIRREYRKAGAQVLRWWIFLR